MWIRGFCVHTHRYLKSFGYSQHKDTHAEIGEDEQDSHPEGWIPYSKRISFTWRVIILLFLLGTLGINIYGDISTDYEVRYVLVRDEDEANLEDVWIYDVKVIQSAIDLWDVGNYGLSIFMFIWSIIWPYCKILMLSVMWFAPLSKRHFENMLYVLEVIGKWALLDIFICVGGIALIGIPLYLDRNEEKLYFQLQFIPRSGLYAFCFAMINTMILTTITARWYELKEPPFKFYPPPQFEVDSKNLVATLFFFSLLLLIGLLVGGYLEPIAEIEAKIKNYTEKGYQFYYHRWDEKLNIFEFYNLLVDLEVDFFLLTLVLFTVFIFPLAYIFLLVLWGVWLLFFHEQYLKHGNLIAQFTRDMYAWQCVDVFLISFAFCAYCIRDIVSYIDDQFEFTIEMDASTLTGFYILLVYVLGISVYHVWLKVQRYGWWFVLRLLECWRGERYDFEGIEEFRRYKSFEAQESL